MYISGKGISNGDLVVHAPHSWVEEIDPPEPDGKNGWYVSDVAITICAEDPQIQPGIPGSGVCGFNVRINGGQTQTILGDCITFVIEEDGNDIIIEYCAFDCVDNIEPCHSLEIDMDQTAPDVAISYELVGGNKWTGWDFEFIIEAVDTTSGMNRVEIYLNGELIKILNGSGPYYWTLKLPEGENNTIKAIAYDNAGNSAYDEITNPTCSINIFSKNLQISNIKRNLHRSLYFLISKLSEKFPVLARFLYIIGGFKK